MRALVIRWIRIMPLAFALVAGVACRPAKSPELTQREIARGAVQAMAWGVRLSVEVCARAVVQLDDRGDGRAEALYETCATGWDTAHAALIAADALIDAADAWDAGKVGCLTSRSLDALAGIMAALEKVGAQLPDDVRVTIADGIRLGSWLAKLAPGGTCVVPAPRPAAPAPAQGVSW